MKSKDRIIIFTRYPSSGTTKTRLIPTLGPANAAELQRMLTEKTYNTVIKFAQIFKVEVEVCYEGGNKSKMKQWLGSKAMLTPQTSGDLGTRMHSAFLSAFNYGCKRVLLIGTDIPELNADHLKKAFEKLDTYDITVGPSTDGGYYLVGLKKLLNIFNNISWSTDKVFEQTINTVKKLGFNSFFLETLTDIDTINELNKCMPDHGLQQPYISVIIPALNEAKNIESAINSARNENAEIIVIDGGSTDNTIIKAEDAGARVGKSAQGRAVQQNIGASLARGKILLFLHADTLLPNDFASHVFDTLMNPKVVLGAFRFKTDLDCFWMKIIELFTNIRSNYFKLPYGDQGFFIRKSNFDQKGGFPETAIAEDLFFVRKHSQNESIKIAQAHVITSARRWQFIGIFRTVLINQIIATGCYFGISTSILAKLYKTQR